MDARQGFDRFQFDNDDIFNHEIWLKDGFEGDAPIGQWNSATDISLQAGRMQFNREALAVDGFKQAWTEMLMNSDPTTNDRFR